MQYRLHTFYINSSIGKWLKSLFEHPHAIVIREESLLGQEIVAYKVALAEEVLKFKNTTRTHNFIEQTRELQLALLEMKAKIGNLSEEQINKEREIIHANSIWRSDLADEGKTIEEIQEIERKIEYDHLCQVKALEEESAALRTVANSVGVCVASQREPMAIAFRQWQEDIQQLERETKLKYVPQNNESIRYESSPSSKREYDFGIYIKQLEEEDNKTYEKILNSTLHKKTIEEHGILSWLFFELSVFFNLIVIKIKYKFPLFKR